MRRTTLFVALFALLLPACGQEGQPRDRSLMIKDKRERQRRLDMLRARARKGNKRAPTTSVIGLLNDKLAQQYAEGAQLIVRFDDMTALTREAMPQIAEVRKALPGLGLVEGKPDELLRRLLRLPDSVVFDPLRPFAFVRTELGWAAVVPTRPREDAGGRLRALDGIYCVAGDPDVVEAYKAGYRKGFFLPGDCSVIIAKPATAATIGRELSAAFGAVGIELGFLDGMLASVPKDIARIDLALRFGQNGMRCDVRIAPERDSATALFLDRMKPQPSEAIKWLPSDGTVYVEFGTPLMKWEGLLLNLARNAVSPPTAEEEPVLDSLRQVLKLLDSDTAAMLDLDPDGSGRAIVVARVKNPDAVRTYFASEDFKTLLKQLAGPGGHLEWMPEVFERGGAKVAAVTGHFSRRMLMKWREQGVFKASLGILLRGPVVVYVAVVKDKLCILAGGSARAETERFLDALVAGTSMKNQHAGEVDSLFTDRLASASADLAALFDGAREAAPFWHKNGHALRKIALRWRMPVAAAATVEGGALRLAVRVPPRMLADAAAKITAALASPPAKADEKKAND